MAALSKLNSTSTQTERSRQRWTITRTEIGTIPAASP